MVLEHLRQVEELWDELLDVAACRVDGAPGGGDGEELPVSVIKPEREGKLMAPAFLSS